jgi:hypothetical protein
MNAFYEHHKDSIRFAYRCFDRILLNGLIQPFQQPERVIGFFGSYREVYPVSRDVLRGAAEQFQGWVKEQADKWGAPIVVEAPKGRRDEFVEPYFRGAKPDRVGRPSGETIRIKRSTAVPAAGSRCDRVPRNGFGRNSISFPMGISVQRCSGALSRCSRATRGLPSRLRNRNGVSRYPTRCGSDTKRLSRPSCAAFSPMSLIQARRRREKAPTCSQNTGSQRALSR